MVPAQNPASSASFFPRVVIVTLPRVVVRDTAQSFEPGSDIYIVYNDQSQTGLPADIFGRKDRQLVVKATYLLQR